MEHETWYQLSFIFEAMRIYDRDIIPTIWDIRFDAQSSLRPNDITYSTHLKEIRKFFEEISGSLIFDKNNRWAVRTFFRQEKKVSNNIILCPANPDDVLLMALFKRKVRALTNDEFTIINIDCKADTQHGSTMYSGDGDMDLDSRLTKWWNKDDYSTFDSYFSNTIPIKDDITNIAINEKIITPKFQAKDIKTND